MSVQSEASRIVYNGNNSSATPYPVPFYFFDDADLIVVVTNEAGSEMTLILNSDYTVSGSGNPDGGSIVTVVAAPNTSKVTIYREVAALQQTSYEEADAFPAKSHERALDRLTMLTQQALRSDFRSLRFRESDGDVSLIQKKSNTLVGVSASGAPKCWTTDEVQSWLNLTEQVFDRPMKTFADASERALAAPDYTGQLATQRDNTTIWISTGTTAGNWVLFDIVPPAESLATSQLEDGILSANVEGRAKMAEGFLTLAKIAAGIFTADVTGREKFASGFIDSGLCAAGLFNAIAPAGAVLQTVQASFGDLDSTSAVIPSDNSIPQNTEGKEIVAASITPASASNKVLIRANFLGAVNAIQGMTMAIFRDSEVEAISATSGIGGAYDTQMHLEYLDSPATATVTTYKMRVGTDANSLIINGRHTGTRLFNGVGRCTMTLQEIKG